jgi:hypothetical protein
MKGPRRSARRRANSNRGLEDTDDYRSISNTPAVKRGEIAPDAVPTMMVWCGRPRWQIGLLGFRARAYARFRPTVRREDRSR